MSYDWKNIFLIMSKGDEKGYLQGLEIVETQLEEIEKNLEKDFTEDNLKFIPEIRTAFKIILNRKIKKENVLNVQNVIHKALTLLPNLILKRNIDISEILEYVFYHSSDFYAATLKYKDVSDEDNIYSQLQDYSVSPLLIHNIEFFGKSKGFDSILEILEKYIKDNQYFKQPKSQENEKEKEETKSVPFSSLTNLVSWISVMRVLLVENFIVEYVDKLVELCHTFMIELPDNELRNTQEKSVDSFLKELLALMKIKSEEIATSVSDTFQFKFAVKQLRSSVIEKRWCGLGRINSIIELVEKNSFTSKKFSIEDMKEEELVFSMSEETLLSWILESKVLEEIFGEKIHEKLIPKSVNLIKFLAENYQFKEKDVSMICSSLGKHQAIAASICETIKSVAKYLPIEIIHEFLRQISELPQIKETIVLDLIAYLSVVMVDSFSTPKSGSFGLDLLWKFCTEDSKTKAGGDVKVINYALDRIGTIFSQSNQLSYRSQFLGKCIEKLKTDRDSVVQSLVTIEKITRSFQDSKTFIETMLGEGLLDTFINSLKNYHILCLKEMGDDVPNMKVSGQLYTHSEYIKANLKFLEYILSSSKTSISRSQLDSLWEIFVLKPFDEKNDSNSFFEWIKNSSCLRIDKELTSYLFLSKMSELDYSTINLAVYKSIENIFFHYNIHENTFVLNKSSSVSVSSSKLSGMDVIWNVYFNGSNLISKSCRTFIRNLFSIYPDQHFALKLHDFRKSAVDSFFQQLTNEKVTESVQLKCLDIISDVIHDALNSRPNNNSLAITFQDANSPKNFSYTTQVSDTLHEVRVKLANFIKIDVETLHFSFDKTNFFHPSHYNLSFAGYLIKETVTLFFLVGSPQNVAPYLDSNPIPIFSSSQNFFKLYQLLDHSSVAVKEKTWSIIERLPHNNSILKSIENLGSSKKMDDSDDEFGIPFTWKDIFQQSEYKFLYSLNIISNIINSNPEITDESWCHSFITSGGLDCLKEKFDEMVLNSPSKPTRIYKKIFSSCLNTLIIFFVNTDSLVLRDLNGLIKVDWNLEFKVLFGLFELCVKETAGESEDLLGDVSSNVLNVFLVAILKSQSGFSEKVVELLKSKSDLIFNSILQSKEFKIRKSTQMFLNELISIDKNTRDFILNTLLSFLPKLDQEFRTKSLYFFQSIKAIVSGLEQSDYEKFNLKDLFTYCSTTLKELSINEPKNCKPHEADEMLIGILQILYLLVDKLFRNNDNQSGLVEELTSVCLFGNPTLENHGTHCPPKCKSETSRREAFALLRLVCEINENDLQDLARFICENQLNNFYRNFSIWPLNDEKSKEGYVGLNNMGSTCYMNSLMQQLYTTPNLVDTLLSIEPPELESKDNSGDGMDGDILMFDELKTLMTSLNQSKLRGYTPANFCQSFKDFEGNPIDVYVQQDAQEFFQTLCDKIDTILKPTDNKMFLRKFCRGAHSNQIKSKDCQHKSSREELFYTFSVEVSQKNNLVDALEDSIQGEKLEGENKYKCDGCSDYVNALKRTTIKTLPNVLVIHLKRFDFNFNTMQKEKLNVHFQFPEDLNMKQFTEEAIEFKEGNTNVFFHKDSYYQYKLKGVVVHRGSTADSGHYYSYIKEPVNGKWLEFNDEVVRPFNFNNLKEECFGGKFSKKINGNLVERDITNSAYMLFYQREEWFEPKDEMDEKQQQQQTNKENENGNKEGENGENKNDSLKLEVFKTSAKDPKLIEKQKCYKEVWETNINFESELLVFDNHYFDFLVKLFDSKFASKEELGEDDVPLVNVIVSFYLQVVIHCKDLSQAKIYFEKIKKWAHNEGVSEHILKFFLEKGTLYYYFIKNGCQESREMLSFLLILAMKVIFKSNNEEFFSHISGLANTMVEVLKQDISWDWYNFHNFFSVFYTMATLHVNLANYFIQNNVIGSLVHLYLGKESPHNSRKPISSSMSYKNKDPDYSSLISLLTHLVCCCKNKGDGKSMDQVPTMIHGTVFDIPGECEFLLTHESFYYKLCREVSSFVEGLGILSHRCFASPKDSNVILQSLAHAIKNSSEARFDSLWLSSTALFNLEDSFQTKRVDVVLGGMFAALEERKRESNFVVSLSDFLNREAKSNQFVGYWKDDNSKIWECLEDYQILNLDYDDDSDNNGNDYEDFQDDDNDL
eukprot:TRINITY_DN8400_c0_g2_i1.p1 TRINITY_DN8400_c0_g2~~TRINITY_DN8400_c0_g2_i1.p1  ORF type:complete len:2136 (-),score=629.79 TRINITY_DN8400_c0_g2_i1:47-6454(-)